MSKHVDRLQLNSINLLLVELYKSALKLRPGLRHVVENMQFSHFAPIEFADTILTEDGDVVYWVPDSKTVHICLKDLSLPVDELEAGQVGPIGSM